MDNIQSSIDKFVEPENRNVGFVFQDFALFPHLNVKQNIEFSENRNKELFNTLIDNLYIKNIFLNTLMNYQEGNNKEPQ